MATKKFITQSPYLEGTSDLPEEDYLYKSYSKDLKLKDDGQRDPIIGIAIFGLGRAGTIHMSNIRKNPRVQLLYIVDNVHSKWKDIQNYWKLENVTMLMSKDSDVVFNDPKVDAVVVASPTWSHENIIRKALEAKKAVFCEKPIAEDRQRTWNCYETAEKNKKPLFCAFNRRFDPSYNNVRERVRNGEVGHVHVIKLTARDSPLPSLEYLKISGGIFHDCMVHDIDLMTWILGEYPTKVTVEASTNVPEIKAIDDFDTVAAVLKFPSGTLGMIDLSRNSNYGYDQRMEVFGPKGMVTASNEQPIHCVTTQLGQAGPRTPPIWYSFASRFRNAYIAEMEQFLDVVLGKRKPLVQAKEILAVSKIAEACEESARNGKSVEIRWTKGELLDTEN